MSANWIGPPTVFTTSAFCVLTAMELASGQWTVRRRAGSVKAEQSEQQQELNSESDGMNWHTQVRRPGKHAKLRVQVARRAQQHCE